MAKTNSKQKNSIKQWIIIAFVVLCVGLLVVQTGMNVRDTLDQERSAGETLDRQPLPTATPAGPTPTLDFSAPVSETGF